MVTTTADFTGISDALSGVRFRHDALVFVDEMPPMPERAVWPAPAQLGVGETLSVGIDFSAAVIVDTSSGVPSLPIQVGAEIRQAVYVSGSGSSQLVFEYVPVLGDRSAGEIALAGPINANGGSLVNSSGLAAWLETQGIAEPSGVSIETLEPVSGSVSAPTEGGYALGSALGFTVSYARNITVDTAFGLPYLEILVGGEPRRG